MTPTELMKTHSRSLLLLIALLPLHARSQFAEVAIIAPVYNGGTQNDATTGDNLIPGQGWYVDPGTDSYTNDFRRERPRGTQDFFTQRPMGAPGCLLRLSRH